MSTRGEEIYQQALQAWKQVSMLEQELEEKRNRQQYEAFQRQEQAQAEALANNQNDDDDETSNVIGANQQNGGTMARKKGGVAVVKTIAKQSRKKDDLEVQQEALRQRAQSLLEEAALQHGHPSALVHMGSTAWFELEDVEQAKEYYRRAGEQGSREGWYNLGNVLWHDDEHPRAKDHAMEAFHKAIQLGDSDAMYFVGVDYLSKEDETDKNRYRQGLSWIESSAEQGHVGALYYLAVFYLQGNTLLGIEPCSTLDFRARLDKACSAGSSDALFLRGHAHYHGDHDVDQDYELALEDFLAAAAAGHADAAVSAGAMLHQGVGSVIPRDQERAFQLYQEAGELGSIEGWRNVVACYALGEGVPKSEEIAKYIAKTMLSDDDGSMG